MTAVEYQRLKFSLVLNHVEPAIVQGSLLPLGHAHAWASRLGYVNPVQ